ncbi:MAG: amino acid ABC transporter permease [Anaerolineaceae bacterium]|nr:amino acid ABC transporter permease [Anaerolineaceae bacterium]
MNQNSTIEMNPTPVNLGKPGLKERLLQFPWWFVALILIAIATIYAIITQQNYSEAFNFIRIGLKITIQTTLYAFVFALFLGLITGLGRISKNVFFRNLATLYVEFIRGVPMLVLIFFIALVAVPAVVGSMNSLGHWIESMGWSLLAAPFLALENKAIDMNVRAIVALSVTYGAFLAEIFRAGIQSVSKGQMEAARSQGMSYGQAMIYIILPQAIRNVLPALGNDFVAMLKDSSLVSVLAVRDITQVARLYAGRSFRYEEAYTTLAILYLSMTIVLSLVVKYIERRVRQDER